MKKIEASDRTDDNLEETDQNNRVFRTNSGHRFSGWEEIILLSTTGLLVLGRKKV
jgi:hypothetical protein